MIKRNLHWIWPLLLIILPLIIFGRYLFFGGFIGDLGDDLFQNLPNKFLLFSYIQAGVLPLWNPYVFMGFPFLADIQVGALYLPNLLAFNFFDHFIFSYEVLIIFHLLLAEIGMYLFLREEGLGRPAAFIGGFAFAFSAAVMRKIPFINMFEILSLIPLFLFFLSKYAKRPRWLYIFLGSILVALMIFAGHPASIAYFLLITMGYVIGNYFVKPGKTIPLGFTMMLIFGGFLSMIQVLPFLNLLQQSARSALDFPQFYEGSMDFSSIWHSLTSWGSDTTDSLYGGLVPLVALAMIFLPKMKSFRSLKNWIVISVIVSFFFMLGEHNPLYQYVHALPFLGNIRRPERYGVILNMAMAVSVALLIDGLLRQQKKWLSVMAIIISILVIADLSFYSFRALPFVSADAVLTSFQNENVTILQSAMQKDNVSFGEARVLPAISLSPNTNLVTGLEYLHGYNPLALQRFKEMFQYGDLFFNDQAYIYHLHKLFSLFNMKYYLFHKNNTEETQKFLEKNNFKREDVSSDFILYRNQNYTPRISSPRKIIYVHSLDEAKKTILSQSFNIQQDATVEDEQKVGIVDQHLGLVTIDDIKYDNQHIHFVTSGKEDGFVVVNDTWYPGWVALIDGKKTEILRTNGLVRGIFVPAGNHDIEFLFSPEDFIIGSYISLSTLFLLLLIVSIEFVIKKNKVLLADLKQEIYPSHA